MANFDPNISIEAALGNIEKLGIKYDELPQLPVWAPLAGRSQHKFRAEIATRVMMASAFAGRELTQTEKDALAQHFARFQVIRAWDTPVIVASTIAFYRGTYAKYGFPFWTPKADKFDPNKMKIPFLRVELPKEAARASWHSLRLLAWYTGCKIFVGFFFLSYAGSTMIAGYNSDPRLKDYMEAIKPKNRRMRQAAGNFGQQGSSGLPDAQESTSPWANTEQSTQDSQPTWPGVQDSPPDRAEVTSRADESYIFDDASPVAPAEQVKTASEKSPQGSAWDRIRSQVRPSGAAQGQGSTGHTSAWARKRDAERTSQSAQEGTSFQFSDRDEIKEDKPYSKERAQEDFDDMLERERRGEASGRR
ncbi:hypothetical protein N0V82_007415 [Gnomoniopsis sp. IMI 355080]|nr:hypothetical protein N0V82_007415 [Gnomoniopsis sp. IMI 355080]